MTLAALAVVLLGCHCQLSLHRYRKKFCIEYQHLVNKCRSCSLMLNLQFVFLLKEEKRPGFSHLRGGIPRVRMLPSVIHFVPVLFFCYFQLQE